MSQPQPTPPPVDPDPALPPPNAALATPAIINYNTALIPYPPSADERSMGMLIWILAILTGWIGPLILWLIKRETSPFIDFHGKQALFLSVAVLIIMIPMFILAFIPFVICLVLPIILAMSIGLLVVQILMAIKANQGEWRRLPLVGQWV